MPDGMNVVGNDAAPWKLDWSAPPAPAPATEQQQDTAPPWQLNWGGDQTHPPAADQAPPPPAAPTSQDVTSQQVPAELADVPNYVPGFTPNPTVQSLGAGIAQGALQTTGSALAGVGTAITGTTAAAAANVGQQAQQQLEVMNKIDAGQKVSDADDPMGYQYLSPEQRTQARAQYEQLVAKMPPPQGSPIATVGKTVGEAVSVPGEWINAQGAKITPPAGYENSISNEVGKNIGALPVYIGSFFLGGPLATGAVAASQTYHDEYDAQIKAGVSPADAATNAGAKALASGALMTLPVSRFVETLSGVAKRVAVAALTRAAADGAVMTTVGQVQHLTNNIIDKATTQPDKDVTAGMFDPKEMAIQAGVGALPGGVAAGAHALGIPGRPTGGPEGEGQGTQGVAAEPQPGAAEIRGGQQGTEGGAAQGTRPDLQPAPPAETQVEPDNTKVPAGIGTPPSQEEGQTLVRTTDSSGQGWVGHGGVLVAEGRNPEVDAHFRDAEQTQPVTQSEDTDAVDRLIADTHTNATGGITWTGRSETPDGQAVVEGHDTSGHMVEIPEERYAVLSQYGQNMYLASHAGEPPLVAVRDPDTHQVVAIGVGRAPEVEPSPAGTPTLEARDEALAKGAEPPLPPEAAPLQAQLDTINRNGPPAPGTPLADQAARLQTRIQQLSEDYAAKMPKTRRQPTIVPPDITDRPSLYRQAFRDAGYDPDVMVNQPITKQAEVLANHIENTTGLKVRVDPKMQPQKAVDSMLDGYRNIQWMAHVMGYPLKEMSLDGVHLRLEPWNPQKPYLGLYSSDPRTGERAIHMPDRSNSFAHEWTHALDDMLGRRLAVDPTARGLLASGKGRTGGLDITAKPPRNATEAFANVLRAIYHDHAEEAQRLMDLNRKAQGTGPGAKAAAAEAQRIISGAKSRQGVQATEFFKSAKQRDPFEKYWAMPEELLARTGEAYIAKQVEEAGGTNEFITKGDKAYLDESTRRFNELYPHGPDRDNIFRAWQDLHAALQREQIMGRGPAAARPGDYDMLDPVRWQKVGSPGAQPAVTAGMRQAVQRSKTWTQRQLEGMSERAGMTGGTISLKPSWKWGRSIKDEVTPHIHSNMGQLDVYRERYQNGGNKVASRIISQMMNKLGWRYGENTLQETPFLRLERRLGNQATNKVDAIMNRWGIPTSRLNLETERQLFDALRGRDAQGNIPNVPAHIQSAAAEIRGVLQNTWYDAERAGIPIGTPRDEGYFPIQLDHAKILGDGAKAVGIFKGAMEADFDSKQRSSNGTFIHDAYSDVPRSVFDKSVHNDMNDLKQVQEALRQENEKPTPDPNALAALGKQQSDILNRVESKIRDEWSDQRARNLRQAIDADDIPWSPKSAAGGKPSPIRARVLSAEARDKLVDADYVNTRPSEILPWYFHTMGRKIAFARTFGPNGEVLHKFVDDLRNAGVDQPDRNEILASAGSALGMLRSTEITTGHRMSTWARALATMTLMGRATYSSIHEPLVTYAQTGSAKAAATAFGTGMRQLLDEINLVKGSDRTRHLSEIAKVLGVVTTRLQETMLQGRMETLAMAPGRVMANYYRRIGLTQVTNANKVGAIAGAHSAMTLWARQILDGKRGTLFDPHGELRELGIPNSEHTDFANWITKLDGEPTLDQMQNTPMGQRWGEAVQRFVDKVVLEPTAAEKPRMANSAIGRFVYGLMSYNYNYQRAVLNPALARRERAVEYERERLDSKVLGSLSGNAKWLTYAASSVAIMMAAQLPVTMIRQEIFDHERANQWRQQGNYLNNILGLTLQRTGVGGIADPVVNALSGLKYDHDISSLAMGAQMNFWVQALKDAVGPFVGAGSPNTNTADYRAVRAGYQLLGMPIAALATALLPGGPKASWLISALGQYATSMTAAEKAAQLVEGPKGQKTNVTPAEREAEQQAKYERAYEQPPQKKKAEGGGGLSAGLLGLLDDFAMPIGRMAARLIR